MKKNNPLWILAIITMCILVILNVVIFIRGIEYSEELESIKINNATKVVFEGKVKTGENCPDAVGGNENSFLQVKYFYSNFCPWCKKEEPILQGLVKNYSNLLNIEWYNINKCPEIVNKYKVSGVPTLIFSTVDNRTEYSHYGFVYEQDLVKLMCDVSGGCA